MNEIAERNLALFDCTELLVFYKVRPKNTKLDGHACLGLENGSHPRNHGKFVRHVVGRKRSVNEIFLL